MLAAEALGTALLLISVIGSGVMGVMLSDGNVAIALLANAIATGCMLYVIHHHVGANFWRPFQPGRQPCLCPAGGVGLGHPAWLCDRAGHWRCVGGLGRPYDV